MIPKVSCNSWNPKSMVASSVPTSQWCWESSRIRSQMTWRQWTMMLRTESRMDGSLAHSGRVRKRVIRKRSHPIPPKRQRLGRKVRIRMAKEIRGVIMASFPVPLPMSVDKERWWLSVDELQMKRKLAESLVALLINSIV